MILVSKSNFCYDLKVHLKKKKIIVSALLGFKFSGKIRGSPGGKKGGNGLGLISYLKPESYVFGKYNFCYNINVNCE